MEQLKIEYLPVSELEEYARNTRKHGQEDVEEIAKSIKKFGFCDPIGIWSDHNVIVEGHGRLNAAKLLGMKEVPVIRLDHLTDAERREYAIAHNWTAEQSSWLEDNLKIEFEELKLSGVEFDLDFDFDFLDDDKKESNQDDIIEDEPEYPDEVETISEYGQVWKLGNHLLMCGDSTDIDDVNHLIGTNKIDMIYTDPPYGMNLNTDYSSMVSDEMFISRSIKGGKKYEEGVVDDFDPEMIKVLQGIKCDELFMFGADYYAEHIKRRNDGSWIVWDKRSNNNDDIEQDESSDKMYGSCFELCWSKKKHKRDLARVKWAGLFGMNQEPEQRRYHPTQKPVALAKWFLERYSDENDTVLDLFGGSGSTLLCCEMMNRKCLMMERDPHYVSVIIQRWENYTGKSAELVEE